MSIATMPDSRPISVVEPDEDSLYEVVDGQRVEMPPKSALANHVAFLIAHHLHRFALGRKQGRGGAGQIFLLDKQKNLQRRPDAFYLSFERWPAERPIPDSDPWPIVPELMVEVISKSNPAALMEDKLAEYFRAGVKLVWVVYPMHRRVYVYPSATEVSLVTGNGELDGGAVLPGFRLSLGSLFET